MSLITICLVMHLLMHLLQPLVVQVMTEGQRPIWFEIEDFICYAIALLVINIVDQTKQRIVQQKLLCMLHHLLQSLIVNKGCNRWLVVLKKEVTRLYNLYNQRLVFDLRSWPVQPSVSKGCNRCIRRCTTKPTTWWSDAKIFALPKLMHKLCLMKQMLLQSVWFCMNVVHAQTKLIKQIFDFTDCNIDQTMLSPCLH